MSIERNYSGFYPHSFTVEHAALVMDAEYPGWYRRINLDTFNIRDKKNCVFGQLGKKWEEETDFLYGPSMGTNTKALFAIDNELWIREIQKRKERDMNHEEPQQTSVSYFPLMIRLSNKEGSSAFKLIKTPDEIPLKQDFRVLRLRSSEQQLSDCIEMYDLGREEERNRIDEDHR